MNDRSKRHLLLILFLTTLYISTSCCVDEPVDEEVISNVQLGGEEIVSNMKMNGLEDYSYKMYVNSSSGEKSPEIYEIMWKRPDFMKTTILNPDKDMKVIHWSSVKE